MKKIALLIAHKGFQQTEYNIPRSVLSNAGVEVITASDEPGIAIAKDGSKAKIDLTMDQIDTKLLDGVFLIGGPGALECLDNSIVYSLLTETQKLSKPLGAICISVRILARAGVLSSKEATGWNGDSKLADIFNKYNVIYIHKPVVTDGKIVTATGPEAAEEFAQSILKVLNL